MNIFNKLIEKIAGYFQLKRLKNWVKSLHNGEVVIAPAEGVYGYCCDPFNPTALEKINKIKQRDSKKGFVVLISNTTQLAQLCPALSPEEHKKIVELWGNPSLGAVSIALPALPNLPEKLTGGWKTVLVRLPHNPFMTIYLKMWGKPLVSTSLNKSGQPPATQKKQLPKGFARLTYGKKLSGQVSKIYDLKANKWLR